MSVPLHKSTKGNAVFGELIPCGRGDPVPLMRSKLIVGRKSFCDVTLPFPNVSSQHCELKFSNGYWRARDLGSRNGNTVDGKRCESKWLTPGDVLGVASQRYKVMYTPQSDAPPPEEEKADFSRGLLDKIGLQRKKR